MRRSFVSASRFALSLGLAAAGWCADARAQAPAQDLSAGGLAPPPAVESQSEAEQAAGPPNQTEKELAKADREDSGRGLEFVWLNGEIGVGNFGLGTFKDDSLLPGTQSSQTGLVLGGGAGVRLVFWTIGARFRYAAFSDWKLWTLGLEGGLHMPLGALEPYATVGVGYASIGSVKYPSNLSPGGGSSDAPSAQGLDARLGVGVDYYLTNMFSVGLNVTGDMLVLSRSAVDGAAAGTPYASDGSSIGAGVTATFVGGLHF